MTPSVPYRSLGSLGTLQQGWPGKPRQTGLARKRPVVMGKIMTTSHLDYINTLPMGPEEALEGLSPRYRLQQSDLLFNVRNRPFRASVVQAVGPTDQVVASGILASLRLYDLKAVKPYYLAGLLRSGYGQTLLQPYMQTSTNTTTINLNTLAQLQVPLPTWETQQRLARMFQELKEVRRCADDVTQKRLTYVDAVIRLAVNA